MAKRRRRNPTDFLGLFVGLAGLVWAANYLKIPGVNSSPTAAAAAAGKSAPGPAAPAPAPTSSEILTAMAANPNLWNQMQQWQLERANNCENPSIWADFRYHIMQGLGLPDPGQSPSPEFIQIANVYRQTRDCLANPGL